MTKRLAGHIASALARPLPPEVEEKTALHVLDTFAAMVSGTRLPAGLKAIPFVTGLGGREEATVVGSRTLTSAAHAALANGMLAHADETDDSHAPSLTHPGCAVVPAALAVAERGHRSGREFLRAVAVGYDVGPRVAAALGAERFFERHHSSHSFGGLFGATAAAGALSALDDRAVEHALAYAVQLASGNSCWQRDPDHIEKAFDFGGMPAQGGVLAASMVAAGFTGTTHPLEGNPGLFAAFSEEAQPDLAIEALGERFEVMRTAIKKWSVGSPIQAALDSLETMLAEHRFTTDDVAEITVQMPRQSAPVVDNREMPDVNLQQQLALLLADRRVTFASSHDRARMSEPGLVALRRRIRIDARSEGEYTRNPRQANVKVHLADGRRFEMRTLHVRGTPANPMTREEVEAKASELIANVLGESRASVLIDRIRSIQDVTDVCELGHMLRFGGSS